MMGQELSRDQLHELDMEFEAFQGIRLEIARAKAAIQYMGDPFPDENIGGGRSGKISKPQQTLVERWDSSPVLQRLYRIQAECSRALERLDDEQLKIYKLKYAGGNYHDWEEVGDLIGYARTQTYKKRYELLRVLAEENGMILARAERIG